MRLKFKSFDPILWVSAALLVAVISRLVLVSLHVVTTFPEITTLYLSPAYPILIWLIWMVLMASMDLIFRTINPKKRSNIAQDADESSERFGSPKTIYPNTLSE